MSCWKYFSSIIQSPFCPLSKTVLRYSIEKRWVLWRACNLTAFIHSSNGPVVHPFASHHEGPGFNPQGGIYICETGILLLALSRYIGDPDVIEHCGLVWGRLHPEPSLGCRVDNVIIPLDLTQLFCPSFTLAAGPPPGFTTDIVGYWGRALWRACNLTAFIHSSTGPVVHPFASRHEGSRSKSQGGT